MSERIVKLFPVILILIAACGKSHEETLTGDLYFSLFRIGSFYNLSDSAVNELKVYFDSSKLETADEEQRGLFSQYKKLKEEKLLYHPFVNLLMETDSVVTLYLDMSDYDKLKKYKRKELQDEGKKIKIVADVKRLNDKLFYCVDLKSVDKVEGKTLLQSRKWKIDDYN
jgi:hypothetical protein